MKLYTFVDLHGDIMALKHVISNSKNADIIICAGDISNFEHNLDGLVKQLAGTKKQIIMIHGNHESPDTLKQTCKPFKNIIFLHKGIFQLEDCTFVGYGGGGFSMADKRFEDFSKKIHSHLKGKIVLIAHAPPHDTKLDDIYGEPRGNRSIRNFIIKEKPALVVCGHLHENAGVEDYIGKTRMINPGKKGKIVSV